MPARPGQQLHDQIRLHPCVRLPLRTPLPHHRRTAQGLTDTSRENRLQARGHPGRPALVPVGGRDGLDRRLDVGEELQEEGAALGVGVASAVADRRVRVLQNVPADVGALSS
ncbi:hypothetical protein ACVWZD_001069 [Streptomyces sp. TE3672]